MPRVFWYRRSPVLSAWAVGNVWAFCCCYVALKRVLVFVLSQDDHRDDRSLPGCFPEGGRHGNQHQRYANKQTNTNSGAHKSSDCVYGLWVAHKSEWEVRACVFVWASLFRPNSLIFLELSFKMIYSDIIEKPLDFTKCCCVCVWCFMEKPERIELPVRNIPGKQQSQFSEFVSVLFLNFFISRSTIFSMSAQFFIPFRMLRVCSWLSHAP